MIVEKNPRKGWAPSQTIFSESKSTDGTFELKLLPGSEAIVRIYTGQKVKDITITNPISPGEEIELSAIDMNTDDESFDNQDTAKVSTGVPGFTRWQRQIATLGHFKRRHWESHVGE